MNVPIGTILQYVSYWITFWTIMNFLFPPREIFNDFPAFQKFYNVVLLLIAYYGSLNIRQFTVALYGKLGVELDTPPSAQRRGFTQGVDATAKAAKKAVGEAADEVKDEAKDK